MSELQNHHATGGGAGAGRGTRFSAELGGLKS